jgi:2-aminoethylphosphonate-pyruvate transaminase
MARPRLPPFLPRAVQAPVIVTFHAPGDPAYSFKPFYEKVKARGYVLYPGQAHPGRDVPRRLHRRDRRERDAQRGLAVAETLQEMGVKQVAPSRPPRDCGRPCG